MKIRKLLFKTKRFREKSGTVRQFCKYLVRSGFTDLLLHSICYCSLDRSRWRKYSLSHICSWKRKEHFNSLFRQSWIFFGTPPKVIKWCLRVSCNMGSEIKSVNFLYSSTLKCISLFCPLNDLSPMHNVVTICTRKHWFAGICRISKC